MTEAKIYIILGALAFIAFCSGALVFSAQHVVDKAGNLDVIHFTGIVVHSFAILTAVILDLEIAQIVLNNCVGMRQKS